MVSGRPEEDIRDVMKALSKPSCYGIGDRCKQGSTFHVGTRAAEGSSWTLGPSVHHLLLEIDECMQCSAMFASQCTVHVILPSCESDTDAARATTLLVVSNAHLLGMDIPSMYYLPDLSI